MIADEKFKEDEIKKQRQKKKTLKSTDSNIHKSTSSKDGIKGAIIVDQATKKRDIMSSFSEFSDKVDHDIKGKQQLKMKEIGQSSDDDQQ